MQKYNMNEGREINKQSQKTIIKQYYNTPAIYAQSIFNIMGIVFLITY